MPVVASVASVVPVVALVSLAIVVQMAAALANWTTLRNSYSFPF